MSDEVSMAYGLQQVSAGGVLGIRPITSGEEWVIHNIYIPEGVVSVIEVYVSTDPTYVSLPIKIKTLIESQTGMNNFHVNNSQFLVAKNTSASAVYIAFDGVVSKQS
ncbi:MAG: hypothetical protein M0R80_09995 [Proteobacteria bacterium]|jgi:hypothetical protein|nr:hypothetical protein [Pseudomonadota bacterium]